MYASIRKYKFKPGSYPGVQLLVNEQFLPLLNRSQGFIHYYAIDEGDDAVTSVTVFESKEQAAACNEIAFTWARETLAAFLAAAPQAANGEILIEHQAPR
jgi:hypothetical protein